MDVTAPSLPLSPEMRRYAALDQRLLAAAATIRILPTVSWPASVEERLIEEFGAGRVSIPDIRYRPPALDQTRAELEAIEAEVDEDHPIAEYLRRTAESWRIAADMLHGAGTDRVTEASVQLYGKPGDAIPGSNRSNLDAARYFVDLADELGANLVTEDATANIPAEDLRLTPRSTFEASDAATMSTDAIAPRSFAPPPAPTPFPAATPLDRAGDELPADLAAAVAETERAAIMKALEATRWNRTAAAKQLGLTLRQLRYRLEKLGIE